MLIILIDRRMRSLNFHCHPPFIQIIPLVIISVIYFNTLIHSLLFFICCIIIRGEFFILFLFYFLCIFMLASLFFIFFFIFFFCYVLFIVILFLQTNFHIFFRFLSDFHNFHKRKQGWETAMRAVCFVS